LHVHFLDPYRPRQSAIHRLDPRVKLVMALAFIFTTALTPVGAWPIYILLLAIILSVILLSDLGLAYIMEAGGFSVSFRAGSPPNHLHCARSYSV